MSVLMIVIACSGKLWMYAYIGYYMYLVWINDDE